MPERFLITEIHICPIYQIDGFYKPDLEYPIRYCVIDTENEVAIDIKTKLKYDYVQTMSRLYFVSQSFKKIKGDRRVAIFPLADFGSKEYNIKEAEKIIKALKNNKEFKDGNDVFDNKQYLEYIKQEQLMEQNKPKKMMKLRKSGK